ncbi:protamine-3 [Pongo abelii]|nr:protamine-3 [Pongo abelii]
MRTMVWHPNWLQCSALQTSPVGAGSCQWLRSELAVGSDPGSQVGMGSLCDVSILPPLTAPSPTASPPCPERQATWTMGSRCAKLNTGHSPGHSPGHSTGHGRGHESSMKKLVACVSQDNFSLSSEGEEEEEEEEEEKEELPVQGKLLLLLEPERQEEGQKDNAEAQQSPEPKQTHS